MIAFSLGPFAQPAVKPSKTTIRLNVSRCGFGFCERASRCLKRVCAVTRRRFPVGASPTRQPLQPEAIGAVMEETKWLKPSISVSRIGDSASVQAATRVNAEQSSKRTMRRSTRQPFRGRLIRLDEMSEAIRSDAAPGSLSGSLQGRDVGQSGFECELALFGAAADAFRTYE